MPRMKPEMLERFLQQPYTGVLATLRRAAILAESL